MSHTSYTEYSGAIGDLKGIENLVGLEIVTYLEDEAQ